MCREGLISVCRVTKRRVDIAKFGSEFVALLATDTILGQRDSRSPCFRSLRGLFQASDRAPVQGIAADEAGNASNG